MRCHAGDTVLVALRDVAAGESVEAAASYSRTSRVPQKPATSETLNARGGPI
jgi:hypothetical protein